MAASTVSATRPPGRTLRRAAIVAAVALLPVLAGHARPDVAPPAAGAGPLHEVGAVTDDLELGPADPGRLIDFSVVLVQPGSDELAGLMAGLADPASPDYQRFLTAEEYGHRFGLPDADIDRVVERLEGLGFRVTARPSQRTSLGVRGTVDLVNATFRVSIRDRLTMAGRPYHAPDRAATVPADLGDLVSDVSGLDNRPRDALLSTPGFAGVPNGYLKPTDVARIFEIDALHADGLRGQGQTIGIVSFDTFDEADVAAFDELAGIAKLAGGAPPDVRRVRLPGALSEPGAGSTEVNLDIDVIRSIAPMAQIIDYEAPNGPFTDVMREIVERAEVDIVSISWGLCERRLSARERAAEDREFDAAFATGISVFVASGDHGAHGCRWGPAPRNVDTPRFRDLALSADYPSVHPGVISVGGTYVSVRTDGTYLDEAGWEDPLSGWGTGGGLSENYDRPVWQAGAGVDNEFSTGKRQVPDVAGPADSDSGFLMVATLPGAERQASVAGGTSASAPFFAASMLLARQLAEREGVGAGGPGRLGALGPLLYRLAASAPPGSLFHDVTRGGNLYHNATPGWDYATGLGSPRVAPLARAIVAALRTPG